MNWIDYTVLAIIAGGGISGFSQGIVRQLISVASFSAGFVIASQHYKDVAQYLGFMNDPNWANIVAFGLITVAITAVGGVVGQILHRLVGLMMFGCFDRFLGAAFGAFLNVLFIEVGLIVLSTFPALGVDKWNSAVIRKLLDFAPAFLRLLPSEFDAVRAALK